MGNFNRGERPGAKKRFDNNDRGQRRGERSERPTMHHAVCSDCGKDCEVPFRPTGDKAVFCSTCFGNKDTSNKSRAERRSTERVSFGDKRMFRAVCSQCRKDCEVPFRPSGDKPVFCSDCFGKGERSDHSHGAVSHATSPDQYKKQFERMNDKLDIILNMLSKQANGLSSAPEPVKAMVEPVVVIEKKLTAKESAPTPKKVTKAAVEKTVVAKKVAKKEVTAKKVDKKEAAVKKVVLKKPAVKKVVKKAVAAKKK